MDDQFVSLDVRQLTSKFFWPMMMTMMLIIPVMKITMREMMKMRARILMMKSLMERTLTLLLKQTRNCPILSLQMSNLRRRG